LQHNPWIAFCRQVVVRIEGQVWQSAIFELSGILFVGWRPDSTNLSGAVADAKYIGTLDTHLTSSTQRFLRILAGCASCAIKLLVASCMNTVLSLQLNFRCDWCLFPCKKLSSAACVAEEALHSIAQFRSIVQQAAAGVTAEAVAVREYSGRSTQRQPAQ
jgi:hypothetical protein